MNETKQVQEQSNEDKLKDEIKLLRQKVAIADSKLKEITNRKLRATSTELATNYHIQFKFFANQIFKYEEHISKYVVSSDEKELLVNSDFRKRFISFIIFCLKKATNDEIKEYFK